MNGSGTMVISAWADTEKNTANLSIRDSGPGIPAEQLDRLFEPFFTTKEEGYGTGLGLSITYNIVRQHNGTIEAQNNAQGGAEFTLTFPLARTEEASP